MEQDVECNIYLSAALMESRLLVQWLKNPTPHHSCFSHMSHPLTSTLIASIIYQLDIASLWYAEVVIGQSCLHALLTNSLAGTGHGRVGPEAMRPSGFGKRGCIQKIDASAGHCTCGYMCLWLHWCSASAAVGWMSQPRSRWSIPTVRSADTRYATLYMTAGEGFEPNQQFFPMGACH